MFKNNKFQQSCHYILELDPDDQCEFVESTPECSETVHYIDYIMLVFCYLGKLYGVPLLVCKTIFSMQNLINENFNPLVPVVTCLEWIYRDDFHSILYKLCLVSDANPGLQ